MRNRRLRHRRVHHHRGRRVHLLHLPNLTTRLRQQSARIPRSVRSRQCSASLSHGAHSNTTNFPSPHRPEISCTTNENPLLHQ